MIVVAVDVAVAEVVAAASETERALEVVAAAQIAGARVVTVATTPTRRHRRRRRLRRSGAPEIRAHEDSGLRRHDCCATNALFRACDGLTDM